MPALLFACDKAEQPAALSSETDTVTQINLRSLTTKAISSIDIFFYADDSLQRLDSYQRVEGPAASVMAGSKSGAKRLVAIANAPSGKFIWNEISSYEALSKAVMDLSQEDADSPVMAGELAVTAGTPCTLTLEPLMSKVILRSVSCDFHDKPFSGASLEGVKVYLTNVNGRVPFLQTEGFTPQVLVNSGGLSHDDLSSFCDSSLIYKEIESPVGVSVTRPGIELYCYPNDIEAESLGRPYTRLVVEGKVNGHTYYYPISLNQEDFGYDTGAHGLSRNTSYAIDLTISRLGSTDPDTPVSTGTVTVACTPQEWEQKESVPVTFSFRRVTATGYAKGLAAKSEAATALESTGYAKGLAAKSEAATALESTGRAKGLAAKSEAATALESTGRAEGLAAKSEAATALESTGRAEDSEGARDAATKAGGVAANGIAKASGVATRSADPDDDLISDINIFFFGADSVLAEHRYFDKKGLNTEADGVSCTMSLLREVPYSVYAIANAGHSIPGIGTFADLIGYRHYMAYPDEFSHGMPMSGKVEGLKVGSAQEITVPLLRAMAKVSLCMDRSALDEGVKMNVSAVRIGNCPNSVKLFSTSRIENDRQLFRSGYDKTLSEADDLNIGQTGKVSRELSLYLLENRQGGDTASLRSYVEMELEYQSGTKYSLAGKPLIYRFYLDDGTGNFDVARNCEYHFTVRPEHDGLLCEDSWRVDKGGLSGYESSAITLHPSEYVEGRVGEDLHIWADVTPDGAPFSVGTEELEYDKARGIYDYTVDADGHGVTLHLKNTGSGILYFEAGAPVNDAAMCWVHVED